MSRFHGVLFVAMLVVVMACAKQRIEPSLRAHSRVQGAKTVPIGPTAPTGPSKPAITARTPITITMTPMASGSMRVNVSVPEILYLKHPEMGLLVKVYDPSKGVVACDPTIRSGSGLELRIMFAALSLGTSTVGKWRTTIRAGEGRFFISTISTDDLAEHFRRAGITAPSSNAVITTGNGLIAADVKACMFSNSAGTISQTRTVSIVATNGPFAMRYSAWVNVLSLGYPPVGTTPGETAATTITGIVQTNVAVSGDGASDLMYLAAPAGPSVCKDITTNTPLECTVSQTTANGDGGVCSSVHAHRNHTRVCTQSWQVVVKGVTPTTAGILTIIAFSASRVSANKVPLTITAVVHFDVAMTSPEPVAKTVAAEVVAEQTVADPTLVVDLAVGDSAQRYHSNAAESYNSGAVVHVVEETHLCIGIHTRSTKTTQIRIHNAIFRSCTDKTDGSCSRINLVDHGHLSEFVASNLDANMTTAKGKGQLCFRVVSSMHGELIVVWHAEPTHKRNPTFVSHSSKKILVPVPTTPATEVADVESPSWCTDGRTLCHGRLTISMTVGCAGKRMVSPSTGTCTGAW